MIIGVTKRKRGRPKKQFWLARKADPPPLDYGTGRKLEGKEFKARKKVLEAEDRERKKPK